MMTRRRSLLIEAAVVAVVLIVLLLVMIPKWQRAQVAGRATLAFRDMTVLIQTIEAYQLDNGQAPFGNLVIESEGNGVISDVRAYYISITQPSVDSSKKINLQFVRQIPQTLLDNHFELPKPPDVYWMQDREFKPGAYQFRNSIDRTLINETIPGAEPSAMDRFAKRLNHDWIGVYEGPCLNEEIRWKWPSRYHTQYDPSNGVISHGFVVATGKSDAATSLGTVFKNMRIPPIEQNHIEGAP